MEDKALAERVITLVLEIRQKMPRLGTRKLYYLLQEELQKLKVGRDKLFKILRTNGMLIKQSRSYHLTTDSHHRFRKHKNKIEQLEIVRPEQVWVSDITYIGTRTNPMYLALVTDAYSKKIMGYDVSDSLSAQGAIRALKMAIKKRLYPGRDLLHHSDRGLQYCCNDYQKLLLKNRISCSMTETYDPYANAVAERVNGILKQEFIGKFKNKKLSLMNKIVVQSITIYNQLRPHLSCRMLTPKQMHLQQQVKMVSYKNRRLEASL
jgi:transposase InsO family protein